MTSVTRDLLADRYLLTDRIATGGMGVVWRARDERLGRDVAIKLIRPEYSDDPTFRQRLRLEARATAAIRSPHVVRLHDVYEEPDPHGGYLSFIVMELVDGQPLSAVLREGRMPIALTTSVLQQAATALAAAHDQQIVHRDIKPANLMLDSDGRVTMLDFGIARAADGVALTANDHVLGTPRYISPEQADGRGATAASDVYSLGIVAFECLAGEVPFDAGSDVAIALAHLRDPVPPLPADVPAGLAGVVERMLAKAPADRPTAAEVAATLAGATTIADTQPITVLAPGLDEPQPSLPVARTLVLPAQSTLATVRSHLAAQQARLAASDFRDNRSSPLRPAMLLPALGVALLLLIVAVVAGGAGGTPAAAANLGHSTQPIVDRQLTPTQVTVDPTRYIGYRWPVVEQRLLVLGLAPVLRYAGHGPADTVVGLAPTGRVPLGTRITVVVSRFGPKPAPAKATPPTGPAGHVPPGHAKKHGHEKKG